VHQLSKKKKKREREAKVCREPPEKALQGIITGYAADPGSISPCTQAANQNVYKRSIILPARKQNVLCITAWRSTFFP